MQALVLRQLTKTYKNGIKALKAIDLIPVFALQAKVVLSGELKKAVSLKGIAVTKGARAAIEAAGGKVEA